MHNLKRFVINWWRNVAEDVDVKQHQKPRVLREAQLCFLIKYLEMNGALCRVDQTLPSVVNNRSESWGNWEEGQLSLALRW